jgi:hypothetical protein
MAEAGAPIPGHGQNNWRYSLIGTQKDYAKPDLID